MAQLADAGIVSGGEGIDHDFAPDQTIEDGEVISAEGWSPPLETRDPFL